MKIVITEPFGRKVKKIKKNPNVKNDLNELLSEMETGKMSGVPISGLFNKVFKIKIILQHMKIHNFQLSIFKLYPASMTR